MLEDKCVIPCFSFYCIIVIHFSVFHVVFYKKFVQVIFVLVADRYALGLNLSPLQIVIWLRVHGRNVDRCYKVSILSHFLLVVFCIQVLQSFGRDLINEIGIDPPRLMSLTLHISHLHLNIYANRLFLGLFYCLVQKTHVP